ncbi:MAG: 50S ribosomal protein L30 [Chloroflexi bacterium]|nr:50S ribosomal protein L30 [Chloroflexota bacterium]
MKMLHITLVRSGIGYSVKHKATIRALGLRHLNQSVDHVDSPVLQGMLRKINHLVKIEEQETK